MDWCIEEHYTDAEGVGALPPQLLTAEALDLGSAAWEDGASLRWPMILAHRAEMAGRVSAEVDASLPGPRPHTAQLLVVFPLKLFDLDGDTSIGVATGVQWWTPGTAPKLKLVNRPTGPKAIEQGTQVATAFATNCDDLERMLLLKEPAPAPSPPPPPPAVPIPLIDENVTPITCRHQQYNPIQRDIVNKQVDLWLKVGVVRPSTSSWCSRTSIVKKKDGSNRVTVDYRPLNAVTKKDSGGLGTLATMHHRIKGSNFFTLLDLLAAYHQLTIREEDRHKTEFRDERGRLMEFLR